MFVLFLFGSHVEWCVLDELKSKFYKKKKSKLEWEEKKKVYVKSHKI